MTQLKLSTLKLPWSTPVKRHKRPGLLITHKGLGSKLDAVVQDFAEAIDNAPPPGPLRLGLASDATQQPGKNLTIRVVHGGYPKHPVAVDLTFRAQGQDLYVKREVVAKMFLAHYQRTLFGVAFAVLWLALYSLLLVTTDAYHALGVSFAQKYFPNNPAAGVAVLVDGWDVSTNKQAILADSSIDNVFIPVKPFTLFDYLTADPVLFLQSLAGVPTVLAAIVGAILILVPRHFYRRACLWIGWPAPEDFDSAMVAHQAWVERIFFDILFTKHDVSKVDVVEVEQN